LIFRQNLPLLTLDAPPCQEVTGNDSASRHNRDIRQIENACVKRPCADKDEVAYEAVMCDAVNQVTDAAGTVLAPSGLSAVALAILTAVKAGDHILVSDSVYQPTRNFCERFLTRMNVETTFYDPWLGAEIETLVRPNTTAIFLETPGSQTFEIQDVPAITAVGAEPEGPAMTGGQRWRQVYSIRAIAAANRAASA